jgi:hypothetical protein
MQKFYGAQPQNAVKVRAQKRLIDFTGQCRHFFINALACKGSALLRK